MLSNKAIAEFFRLLEWRDKKPTRTVMVSVHNDFHCFSVFDFDYGKSTTVDCVEDIPAWYELTKEEYEALNNKGEDSVCETSGEQK